MRLVIAQCSVIYTGRLTASLPSALRLLLIKADGSLSIHCDSRAYKPLNWMNPPCTIIEEPSQWRVCAQSGDELVITLEEVIADHTYDLRVEPGLSKDGVEANLQQLLAQALDTFGTGWRLIRREYPTAIGPVDLLCQDESGTHVAVEVKRRAEIDGVEQLTRYVELLNRDTALAPVKGVLAAQEFKKQARTLAQDRGFRCVTLNYEDLKDEPTQELRLF